jgi:hypothetical protein
LTATGIDHPIDESWSMELFKAPHKHGVLLIAEEIYSLAIENQWPNKHTKNHQN